MSNYWIYFLSYLSVFRLSAKGFPISIYLQKNCGCLSEQHNVNSLWNNHIRFDEKILKMKAHQVVKSHKLIFNTGTWFSSLLFNWRIIYLFCTCFFIFSPVNELPQKLMLSKILEKHVWVHILIKKGNITNFHIFTGGN